MAWGVFLKRNGYEFEFSSIKLGKFFSIGDDLHVRYEVESIYQNYIHALDDHCSLTTPRDFITMEQNLITELQTYEPKQVIRGKFEIWFLLKFTEAVKKLLKKMPELDFRYSEALMGERDIVKFLGPRLHPIPDSLQEFLSRNTSRSFS